MAYPATLAAYVDLDPNSRPMALITLCTYVNAINAQQSGGNTHAVAVPDQSTSSGGSIPGVGLSYLNNCLTELNNTITRAALATPPGVLWVSLDTNAFMVALNVVLAKATAVKVALGG